MSTASEPEQRADGAGYPIGHTYVFDIGAAQIERTVDSLHTLRHRILTVVHVEDFATGRFEACITFPDLSFKRISGKMWRVA